MSRAGDRIETPRRAKGELPKVHGAAIDIAADQVGVHGLQRSRWKDAAGQDALAKAGERSVRSALRVAGAYRRSEPFGTWQ